MEVALEETFAESVPAQAQEQASEAKGASARKKVKSSDTSKSAGGELDELRELQRQVLLHQLQNQQQLTALMRSAECAFDALNNLLPHMAKCFDHLGAASTPRSPDGPRFSL